MTQVFNPAASTTTTTSIKMTTNGTIRLSTSSPGGGDAMFMKKLDLVKRHLMYAVREEVEILKQQITEMMERIGQLEYENTVLRSEAKPETLNKLLLPRVTQPQQAPAQGQLPPSQPSSMVVTPAPTPVQSQQTTPNQPNAPQSMSQVQVPQQQQQQQSQPQSQSQSVQPQQQQQQQQQTQQPPSSSQPGQQPSTGGV